MKDSNFTPIKNAVSFKKTNTDENKKMKVVKKWKK